MSKYSHYPFPWGKSKGIKIIVYYNKLHRTIMTTILRFRKANNAIDIRTRSLKKEIARIDKILKEKI